ncbi:hypothetical protein ACWT_1275 [Actinoplanes sp. SE50]|uniref:DUF4240 domain-containing protein n=1 Tax=unclassified Actinoplanes TaxID=2626549 RepID=UPI00023EBB07|nr:MULTISPECIES: DUF4240 domain-containing protein [unclassified Actinoplanes]AEV82293.1 hypothetical protein ACPL_1396 [Actinoplanes sp. SE50/110]ATO80690.1 hypothetical protein ACWT_1275 [Actinoplanes sp. SE50]SLL98097.1 hypothetical protein ACSP50_1319 [Actinoplanes sp. SE50/110]
MRTDDFWAVIDRATTDRPASPAVVAERAVAELATHDPEEIVAWGRHLDKVMAASGTEDLWAAAYLINSGADEAGFDAFRGWLIAHGRKAVAAAVQRPDVLANVEVIKAAADSGAVFEAEEVLGIAARAYEQATGEPLPAEERPRIRPAVDDLWDFDNEDEMRRRLPKLSALFLEPPD